MKKYWAHILMLICSVVGMVCFSTNAYAEGNDVRTTTGKLAYIDVNDNLILQTISFSATDYTYYVRAYGETEVLLTGSLSKEQVEQNAFSVSIEELKKIYVAKAPVQEEVDENGEPVEPTEITMPTAYEIELISNETGDYYKVPYYCGEKVTALNVTENSGKVTATWSSEAENKSKTYMMEMRAKANPLARKCMKKMTVTGTDPKTMSLTAGDSYAGVFSIYLIATYGNMYGYGAKKDITYIPTVTGVKVTPGLNEAQVTWNRIQGASYEVEYKQVGTSEWLTEHKKKKITTNSWSQTGLISGKQYSFRVSAYVDSKLGERSSEVKTTILILPGAVQSTTLTVDDNGKLRIDWTSVKNATSYAVYVKKKGQSSFDLFSETRVLRCSLKTLDQNATYTIRIYAKNGTFRSNEHSKDVTVTPASFIKKNKDRILASRVKSIRYDTVNQKVIYDSSKKYTQEINESYVNYYGFSSVTKYLIFTSLYTQQTTIFKGSKGKWKQIKTFEVSSGSYENHTPSGTFQVFWKEKKWQHAGWKSAYITHFKGMASYHTYPMWDNGVIKDGSSGKPVSSACLRCPVNESIWIYNNIPYGTTVRVK